MDELEKKRTARQLRLPGFNEQVQQKLADARVLIVGAGGLGCPALQQLVAAGVGTFYIYDDDKIELSNLQRQVLFGVDDIGKPKAEVAAARAKHMQPGVNIIAKQERLTADNIFQALENVDIVLEGSDNFATKYLVADACEITGTPLVWGTVLQYYGNSALWYSGPGSENDRGVGLRDLFPEQLPADAVPDCATAGVLGVTTSVVAGLMATAAIAWLTGLDRTVGRVSVYQALKASVTTLNTKANPNRQLVTELGNYQEGCMLENTENANLLQMIEDGKLRLVDIREPYEIEERAYPENLNPILIPMGEFTLEKLQEVLAAQADTTTDIVIGCRSGARSGRTVAEYAEQAAKLGLNLYNLPGGILAIGE